MALDYVPEGQQCVAPYLIVPDVEAETEFLQRVFGAEPVRRTTGGAGGIHAEVRIGDTVVMLGQPPATTAPQPANLHAYVPDVDLTYQRALEAGARDGAPPAMQAYGEPRASFTDPAGHCWWIASKGATTDSGRP